jgi:DUF971 family protein
MIEPVQIVEESDSEVSIKWSDDTESRFTADQLRRACPCAGCVNEWTGEKTLDPAKIADDLTLRTIALVGRYALNFQFSDGHETGIFSFKFLREAAPKAEPPA